MLYGNFEKYAHIYDNEWINKSVQSFFWEGVRTVHRDSLCLYITQICLQLTNIMLLSCRFHRMNAWDKIVTVSFKVLDLNEPITNNLIDTSEEKESGKQAPRNQLHHIRAWEMKTCHRTDGGIIELTPIIGKSYKNEGYGHMEEYCHGFFGSTAQLSQHRHWFEARGS